MTLQEKAAQYESYFDVGEQHGYLCVNKGEMAEAFKDGARWQKEQMLKDAVEGEVVSFKDGHKDIALPPNTVFAVANRYEDGDRVKIVIIPDEEDEK